MKERSANRIREYNERAPERGFSIIQLVIVVAIVSIVSTFALVSVTRARESVRLQNSMRTFAGRLEKARLDAIRRHRSSLVEFTGSNTYTITMDYDGAGTASPRTFSLENNISITNSDGSAVTDFPVLDFDWRGRTTQCFTTIRMKNTQGEASTISVTSSGDITIDTTLGATVSPGTYSNVNQASDVSSSVTVSGTNPAACTDPCGSCPSASSGPVTSSPPAGCSAFTLNKSTISIKKNGANTDSFTVTVTANDTITVTQTDGRSNLSFTPSPTQAVTVGTPKTFTVKSLNNSKGKFPIRFTSACNASNIVDATVTVTN